MSFSYEIKSEVARLDSGRTENISELSAIIRNVAKIDKSIIITIENSAIARRIFKLIKDIYDTTPIITIRKRYNFNKGLSYILDIKEKMAQAGMTNLSAYLRRIAIDGMIVRLELPELKEMVSLLRYASNNINQIARRMNESGRVYGTDLEQVVQNQEQLWNMANGILVKLAGIK